MPRQSPGEVDGPTSLFEIAFDHAPIGMAVVTRDGRLLATNPPLCRMLGYSAAELCSKGFQELTHPDDLAADLALLKGLLADDIPSYEIEKRYLHADGSFVWGRLSVAAVRDAHDQIDYLLAQVQDITAHRHDRELNARQAHFRSRLLELVDASLQSGLDESFYGRVLTTAVDAIPGAQAGSLMRREDDDRFRFVAAHGFDLSTLKQTYLWEHELYRDSSRPGPQLIYGFDRGRIDGERNEPLWSAGDTASIRVSLSIPLQVGGASVGYFNLDNFEDPDAFSEHSIEMARLFAGQVAGLIARLQLEERLRQLAFHDALTGLPNRKLMLDRVEQAMQQCRRTKRTLALMFIDLDDFKEVNDRLGHHAGDALLVEVARRLSSVVRASDTAARWGGDEFVLLLTNLGRPLDSELVAERVMQALRGPFEVAGHRLDTSVSLGLVTYSGGATSLEELFKRADSALYRAKADGKGTHAAHPLK